MKTHVLLISKNFLSTHPRAGKPTNFAARVLSRIKKHTIRTNFRYWEKKIKEVQAGEAVLSIRQWTGRPYNSKQREILQLTTSDKVGIQFIEGVPRVDGCLRIDQKDMLSSRQISKLAKNDGLTRKDFNDWFKEPLIDACIIHFTKLRY